MRYRTLITIGAVVAACGALGTAPALAGQPSGAHAAVVAAGHPGHAVVVPHTARRAGCDVQNCRVEDAGGAVLINGDGTTTLFRTPVVGVVNQTAHCWPFSYCPFDTLYSGHEVLQFVLQNGVPGDCLQTDSVHSGVIRNSCGSHDAGTYWVTVGSSPRGACSGGSFWLVNVGITNHYNVYPYGYAMFVNSNGLVYVQSHRALGDDDQWCVFPD